MKKALIIFAIFFISSMAIASIIKIGQPGIFTNESMMIGSNGISIFRKSSNAVTADSYTFQDTGWVIFKDTGGITFKDY